MLFHLFSAVQSLSRVLLFAAPWSAAHQASLSFTSSQGSLKLKSIESVMPSSHLVLCHPLLLLPSIFPSIRVFSNELAVRIRWPKYWSFSFSISPFNEYSGLISFRMDRLDLLAVQGTFKSLLQHHSSKASILQCSAFFTVKLSHPYMTTGKTSTWLPFQKWQNGLCSFLRQTIQYHSNPIYALSSNAEEVEVEWFYEDLQDLLKLTPQKDVLFIIGEGMQR